MGLQQPLSLISILKDGTLGNGNVINGVCMYLWKGLFYTLGKADPHEKQNQSQRKRKEDREVARRQKDEEVLI